MLRHHTSLAALQAALLLGASGGCSKNDPGAVQITCGAGTKLMGTSCVPTDTDPRLVCGNGTREMSGECLPISVIGCGAGTREENGTCVPINTIMCGTGTHEENGVCVPSTTLTCGAGTIEVDGSCVPVSLEGQHFENPLVLLQDLTRVGSHTDEVRIRPDNKLINCSYSFNVIDATNAQNMRALTGYTGGRNHTIPGDTRRPGCKHLAWDGDLVFTTHLGNIRNPAFLSGWDITDPANPVQLAVMQEPGVSYEAIEVVNHNIYVALHENGLGVYRYDTATSTPSFARIGGLGGFTNAWGVAARDTTVFVADGLGGFATVDASDPTQPVERGRVALPGWARAVVVDGDHAYVAASSGGVAVIDISELANPRIAARIEMPGTALRLDYSEGHIFVAAWNDVRVYDVSTPASPRFVAAVRIPRPFVYSDADRELPTMRIFGVAARGNDVFVGTWDHPYSFRLDAARAAPNLRLPESAARIDFGPVAVGASKTLPFEITNQGTAPLTVTDTWAGGSFSVTPRQAMLLPGESATLEVTYRAETIEQESGYLNIASDDPAYPIRKPYLVGNAPGVSIGAPLPPTTATMLDGTTWNSSDALGSVLLISYYATYCPNCTNHLPDLQERFWTPMKDRGLSMVALDPREPLEQIGQIQAWADSLQVVYPLGVESPATTYDGVVANFTGPNPFPVDVIVGKDGTVRYASHEYDPDTMMMVIEEALAE